MELKYRDNEGDARIWIEGGTDQEVEALAKRFDEAASDCVLADKLIGLDALWAATGSSDPRAIIAEMGEEMELLRRELAEERRCTAAYQARLAQVAGQKAVPGGWVWWPMCLLAGMGIVYAGKCFAALMGWVAK